MVQPPPATIGMALEDVDTPALILDLDPFERNLRRMADATTAKGIALRPHAKTHKSVDIAKAQVAQGAVGQTCQKVSEAEVLVDGGIADVFVSNQIVAEPKVRRLCALAKRATVTVSVDHAANVALLQRLAQEAGVTVQCLVELNVGDDRVGIPPREPALELAHSVAAADNLTLRGIQAYAGSAQHIRKYRTRRSHIKGVVEMVRATRDMFLADGLACDVISGAGTGSYEMEASSGVYTEIQAGSYIFMDVDYGLNLEAGGAPKSDFEHSLFVLAQVISLPAERKCTLDAGTKAVDVGTGYPRFADRPDLIYARNSDEHGKVEQDAGSNEPLPALGEKVRLTVAHCDPTVNLHDWYVCVRGGVVEALWPVSARGALF